jgi:hypothetical protein
MLARRLIVAAMRCKKPLLQRLWEVAMRGHGITALTLGLAMLAAPAADAGNLVVNGDFSAGNSGFTSDYSYVPFITTEGEYTVTTAGNINNANRYGDWTAISTDPTGGDGNVLLVNGAPNPGVTVWSETVGVDANTNYLFEFWAADVNNTCVNSIGGSCAVLSPSINGVAGPTLQTTNAWTVIGYVWNSGSNTSANLGLVDFNTVRSLNDFAVDDLSFSSTTLPPPIPEPTTWILCFMGFGALAMLRSLRNRSRHDAAPIIMR